MTEVEVKIIHTAISKLDTRGMVKARTLMVRPKLPSASPVQAKYMELAGHSDSIEQIVGFYQRLHHELNTCNSLQISYHDTPGCDRFGNFRIVIKPKRFTTKGGSNE